MMEACRKLPSWDRLKFDACCWSGSRRVAQTLEGNVLGTLGSPAPSVTTGGSGICRTVPTSDPSLEESQSGTADLAYSPAASSGLFCHSPP